MKVAVVAGGTGLVGKELVRQLLLAGVRVVSFSRRPLGFTHSNLREVRAEITALPHLREELKGDFYFCCLGTTRKTAGSKAAFVKVDYDAVVDFARIAKHHGAGLALVSAAGANSNSLFFYSQVKGAAEDALRVLDLPRLYIFKPALLLGERQESRPFEAAAQGVAKGLQGLMPKFSRRFSTNVDDLAALMIAAARGGEPSREYFAEEIWKS
jgi:uncharacterized protein YbjT (DUF2867 family)